jgi:adenylate cyclase
MASDTLISPRDAHSVPMCVLFADLAGSTALFESLGNTQAAMLVTKCTEAMAAAAHRGGGNVAKVLGDGVLCVFDRPERALMAARDLRMAIAAQDLEANVGIEFGDVVLRDGDVFGDAVNLAARLSDVAQRGEILVGEGAYRQLDAVWRGACRSLAHIVLKGKSQAIPVWRLESQDEMQTGPFVAFTQVAFTESMGAHLAKLNLRVEVRGPDGTVRTLPATKGASLVLGRTQASQLQFEDARVSRSHASIAWQVDHFELSDHSSNGTWLRFSGASLIHTLRRSSMALVGAGEFSLGASLQETVPEITASFEVLSQ